MLDHGYCDAGGNHNELRTDFSLGMEVLGMACVSVKHVGLACRSSSVIGGTRSRLSNYSSADRSHRDIFATASSLQRCVEAERISRRLLCQCSASCSAYPFLKTMAVSQLFWAATAQSSFEWKSYIVSFAPVILSIGVSRKLEIGLEKDIQKATLRSFVQLLALGYSLKFLIEQQQIIWSCFGIVIMLLVAGRTAGKRAKRLPKSRIIATISLLFGALGIVAMMIFLGIFPLDPWFIIPTAAHVIGHSMAMLGGTMNSIHREISQHKDKIEASLALGATPQQAVRLHVQRAFSVGMGPMVDEVKAMGLVSLPGNMTGMLMGGAGPLEAVKLQLQVINVVLGAAALCCLISSVLGWRSYFTEQQQLLSV